ncbi:glycosyltransferase family 4 protein [Snuella sedimenti]|uniref:Glycosyltransferase family 4 protein n=1 Tax=Snuella sedimenti TaxID=2798802 RepID=A0A8J7IHM5_9FLAO|nr:glycosyltransferase family 4 protein [Snuella sedimenti]MBJ6368176.1 glycosyltransferase family 4 protein [Snuella sedimenti]
MKEVLIITNYFPPETGAAANRIFHLAEGLEKRNFKVSVITPLPNYPSGKIFTAYRGTFKHSNKEQNLTVHRLWIYASNSKNKFVRLIAMLSYSFSLLWFFMWHKLPKTIIIQSPPLLVAFTCIFFLRFRKRQLILNVSDLWPLAGLELGAFKKNVSYRLLECMERFNYKHASVVLGQSQEILDHISSIEPKKPCFLYRNFPNFDVLTPILPNTNTKKLNIVYAGLLGVAQSIYKLCKALDYSNISFHIYGTGPEQKDIETFIANHPELDMHYHGELPRNKLLQALLQYDLTIIPLRNRIYGSVPSKIFEYARLGLPMLYFGGGEGETIINTYRLGWLANSGDYQHLNQVIANISKKDLNLQLKERIQKTALEHFDFNKQLDAFITFIG